jgi:hypothetical protein
VLQSGVFSWAKDGLEFMFDFVVPVAVLTLAWAYQRGERRRPTRGSEADEA